MTTTMTEPDVQTDKAHRTETLLAKSVCLILRCGGLGNHKKISVPALDITKDGEALSERTKREIGASKRLVDSKELKACNAVLDSAKSYLRSVAVAGARVFGSGTYLVPKLKVGEVEHRLAMLQVDLAQHAQALKARWADIVAKRQETLGPAFDAADYMTADDVAAEYVLDWDYVSFRAPELVEEVDHAVYAVIAARTEAKLSSAYDEVVDELYAGAQSMLDELVERLSPRADGKRKALYDTALRDLTEYVERLPARASMVGAAETVGLKAALARVAALADGLDVSVLKKAEGVRESLRTEAAKASALLAAQVTERKRGISFGGKLG